MAFRFNESGEYVDSGISIPAWDACTIMAWVYIVADRATYSYILQWPNSGGSAGNYCGIDPSRQLFVEVSSLVTGTTLAVGTWYHIALASGPSNATVYLNGVQDSQTASASFTPVSYMWGGSGGWLDGRVAALKVFGAELTAAQVAQEMRTVRPSGRIAPWAWYPGRLATELADFSGNGRTLTSYTTPTTEDGPPVGWGAAPLVYGVAVEAPLVWYPQDGTAPWSSMWRPARV